MYKKFIITFLIFFAPAAFFEHHKKDKSSQLSMEQFDMNETNNLQLFDANEENSIEIKNCWGEGDLPSQKRYCSSVEKVFHNFNR